MKDYYYILKEIHRILKPKIYVEVGIRNGESFQLTSPDTLCVGIDPNLEIQVPINANSLLFNITSDEFFNKFNIKQMIGNKVIDLAFIDGMHLFEFALRDFMNLERFCGKNSYVLLHDCLPVDRVTSERERKTQVWTGDVWKLIACLKKYRPDLDIKLLDVSPSGLAIITNLNPKSEILSNNLNNIYDEFIRLDYSYFVEHKHSEFFAINDCDINTGNIFPTKKNNDGITTLTKILLKRFNTNKLKRPKCLCVLLCYNDADILGDVIDHMLTNHHDIIAWDHGSDDNTPEILDKFRKQLRERKFVPRSFDFYNLYQQMSKNLIDNYIDHYDWISWPDEDEILEGPDRGKTYYEYVCDVYNSKYNYIRFNNNNFWFTEEDDMKILSPIKRIKRYSIFPDCAPRIRAWRASVTNIREFNHNVLDGEQYPVVFNLRHYPMRSVNQLQKRISKDRVDLQRGDQNYHFNNLKKNYDKLFLRPDQLNYDDGISILNPVEKYNWREIYGYPTT